MFCNTHVTLFYGQCTGIDVNWWRCIQVMCFYCTYLEILLGEVFVGFQDVASPPSCAMFSTTFLKNCGGGESLRTTTCLWIVWWGVRKGTLPLRYSWSIKVPFCVSHDHMTVKKMMWSQATHSYGDVTGLKTVVSVLTVTISCTVICYIVCVSKLCSVICFVYIFVICSLLGQTLFIECVFCHGRLLWAST